jgi:hypothetical protein
MQLAAIPRTYVREEPRDFLGDVQLRIEAEELLLADVDSYSNWLAMHCSNVQPSHTRPRYVPRDAVDFARFVESLDVPQLVALSHYPRIEVAGAAACALRERYVADSTDHLSKLAAKLAGAAA